MVDSKELESPPKSPDKHIVDRDSPEYLRKEEKRRKSMIPPLTLYRFQIQVVQPKTSQKDEYSNSS